MSAAPTDPNRYPPGWDRAKVQAIIDYYEAQSEDEELAELQAAWASEVSVVELEGSPELATDDHRPPV